MPNFWMVRAGEGGYLIDEFEQKGCVGIGWREAGDFTAIETLDLMRARVNASYPNAKPSALGVSAGMAFKFRKLIRPGDRVVSYDPERRQYLLGTVIGEYEYCPGLLTDYPHVRRVQWQGRVSRDALKVASRNTLGSVLTLFEPGPEVLADLESALSGNGTGPGPGQSPEPAIAEFETIYRDTLSRAHEFIKDRLRALSAEEMEELAAALLRGMGYRARVSRKGPDRGTDVIASRDGLGFEQPRIKVEVKHRTGETIGSQQVRSFLGSLREGDRGLYVSTGGFTKEAHYEAERATVPVTLVDLDLLATLIVDHYERFDMEGRSIVPLVRVYWPVN